jgi:hypothetical protein
MEGWSDFYTLVGSTAATLIGLIFVVISLGADHAKKGDEHRLRVGVTPALVRLRVPTFFRSRHDGAAVRYGACPRGGISSAVPGLATW